MTLSKTALARPEEPMIKRYEYAISMLRVHGIITDGMYYAAQKKIVKLVKGDKVK
jgi:hypothetical protein